MPKKVLRDQLKDLFTDMVSAVAPPQGTATDQKDRPSKMINIKGQQDGLLVILDEQEDWALQMAELETTMQNHGAFFAGGRLAIQVGKRLLSMADIQNLQAQLAQHNLTLWAVFSDSKATQAVARYLNLATELPSRQSPPTQATTEVQAPPPEVEEHGRLIHRTLRSGQKVRHPGHVTVIGDVNPGAEIIAGGNIIVWGRLQGLVHAGAMGDDGAVVCALDLSPTQLRIGSYIARPPEEKRRRRVRPETVSVIEGQIVAEPWDSKKQRRK